MREFAECTSSFLWELYIQHITHNSIYNPSIKVVISRDFFPPIGKFFSSITSSTLKNLKGESRRSTPGIHDFYSSSRTCPVRAGIVKKLFSKRINPSTPSSISILSLSSSYNLIDQRKKCNWICHEIMSR